MRLRYSDEACETLQALPDAQRGQARRLIRAIMQAGVPIGRRWLADARGRQLWVASALDTCVIHRVVYEREGDMTYVVQVLVFPTPPDPSNR